MNPAGPVSMDGIEMNLHKVRFLFDFELNPEPMTFSKRGRQPMPRRYKLGMDRRSLVRFVSLGV
jgi:hypothetical protein